MSGPEFGEDEPELVIDCSDGRRRAVSFQAGSKLVRRSRVISESSEAGDAVEKQGLGERQLRGLGVPLDTHPGQFLDAEPAHEDPL